MSSHRKATIVAGLAVATGLAVPKRSDALDIASTSIAIGGGAVAVAGLAMQASDDPKTKETGKTMITVGLIVSAVFTASATTLDLLALGALGYLDRVEDLEQEVSAGGGPITDALAEAYGLSRTEVLELVQLTLSRHPASTAADAQALAADLRDELVRNARMTDELAGRILYELYRERGRGDQPWRQLMSDLSGVPVDDLNATIDALLDERLASVQADGEVILSARSVLAQDAARTLDGMLDRILDNHWDLVQVHLAELSLQSTVSG